MNYSLRLATLALLLAAFRLPAATLTVGPGGYSTIQQAVDAAAAHDLILVTNGTYGATTVNKLLRVRSINGPQVTLIIGGVNLDSGASLYGFTLSGGPSPYGSVVACWTGVTNAFLTNCVITSGWNPGGNGADGIGGGVYGCTLYQCLLTGNYASYGGGGAAFSTLYNCTLAGNSSVGWGGGVFSCALYNSIVCSNSAHFPNVDPYSTLYSCFADADPLFVDLAHGNLRLQSNSPCINAGNNAFVSGPKDLDGRPRIAGPTVDLGPYEFQPGISGAFIAWLQQYGLRTDGLDDLNDSDADGLNNWQEWVCGTCPTNPVSALRLLSATPNGSSVTVSWQSAPGVNYFLARSATPVSPFTLVANNIPGQAGTTTYADTNAPDPGAFFYRVGVNCP